MILDSLIIANILVPPLCIIKLCLTKKGFKFDHVFIISAGFLYYWLFPIVNYQYNLFGYWNESKLAAIFNIPNHLLKEEHKISYLAIILLIYIAFITGEYISSKIKYIRPRIAPFSLKPLIFITFVYFAIFIMLTVASYEYYFKGYTASQFPLKGNLISLNVTVLTLLYLWYFHSTKTNKFINIFINWFFVFLCISSIFLASLGNRTWIMSSILSFLIFYTNYYKRIPVKFIIIGFCFLTIILGLWPQVRAGHFSNITLHNTVHLGLQDSFVIHNSLKYYLLNNEIPTFTMPKVLFSQLFNMIPSIILPSKDELYFTFSDFGVDLLSIQSASHTFPTLMSHFGIIGTIMISLFFPFLLNYFKHYIHFKASYIIIVAYVSAAFFRDFDIFAIKIFLQFSILMPIIYLLMCNIFATRRKNK